jgi:hypothetical protein
MTHHKIRAAISDYVQARKKLIALGESHPELIGGNDNIIGRIGEYIAIHYLEQKGQKPRKVQSKSNKGFDLAEGKCLTQVKVITQENKNGRNVRLKKPWTQFVLIVLGDDYEPKEIGLLTEKQHNKALKEHPHWSKEPIVKRSMLGDTGLVRVYGEVTACFKY